MALRCFPSDNLGLLKYIARMLCVLANVKMGRTRSPAGWQPTSHSEPLRTRRLLVLRQIKKKKCPGSSGSYRHSPANSWMQRGWRLTLWERMYTKSHALYVPWKAVTQASFTTTESSSSKRGQKLTSAESRRRLRGVRVLFFHPCWVFFFFLIFSF